MVTFCSLLSITFARNWHDYQIDVHNAFLRGDFLEEVHMHPLFGFHTAAPGQVSRSKKSFIVSHKLLSVGFINLLLPWVSIYSILHWLPFIYL